MDIAARIQQLEDMIREAKSMPLSSSVLVNREELLELIGGMREALPEEIKQARWVVRDREELLLKARREAESIVGKGHQEQARLLEREAVVQAAQEEAERIVGDARDQARQVRLEAEDYVDAKLAQFEITLQKIQENLDRTQEALGQGLENTQTALSKTADQVSAGRDKLRGAPAHPAQALASEEEQPGAEAFDQQQEEAFPP
jgi:vacuolar-type H+-ATPase subunit H